MIEWKGLLEALFPLFSAVYKQIQSGTVFS